jgi:hypothetical protein
VLVSAHAKQANNQGFNPFLVLLKELSPTRNQLTVKTHEENSKNSKTEPPHILGVSMKGALTGKKKKKKICGFGQSRIPAETALRSFRKLDDSFKHVVVI